MWVVIVFMCMVNGTCGFIDSPPVYSESECTRMMLKADMALEADPAVATYASKCIQIKVMEVGESR